jgi:hypothetical protein
VTADDISHRMTWRCTECAWGVSGPGRIEQSAGQSVAMVDDADIVHEVIIKHLAKHDFAGNMEHTVLKLYPGEDWDDYD